LEVLSNGIIYIGLFLFIIYIISNQNILELQGETEEEVSNLNTSIYLKEKILYSQNKRITQTQETFNSFSGKRAWVKTIQITEKQLSLSNEEALSRIQYEYEAYTNQSHKFQMIINNIKIGEEKFYSDESIVLFKQYIEVIEHLKSNLSSMKKNIKNMK
jgi:hypothetical protein